MIDLYSDTVTRPGPGMRAAIAAAGVGDEQRGEDPTTAELEERIAQMTGCDCALFLPSATMANAIAIQMHCGPGDELLSAENSHVLCYEGGGAAVHARATVRGIPTWTGLFGRNAIAARLRSDIPHSPEVTLVVVENTTNQGGGRPWPLEQLDEVTEFCQVKKIATHLDGSRLFNAAVAQEVDVQRLAGNFDTVTICLSKGLGCPMGAVLAFPERLRREALRLKHRMGGAMRQSGLMAAAGLYALEHNVERLAEDHRNAARLAEGLSQIAPLVVESERLRTNMVYFELPEKYNAQRFLGALAGGGVRLSEMAHNRFRAVTHLDVTTEQVDRAVEVVRDVCASLADA